MSTSSLLNRLPPLKTRINMHVSKEQMVRAMREEGVREKVAADVADALPSFAAASLLAELKTWSEARAEQAALSLQLGFYFALLRHLAIQTRDHEAMVPLCLAMSGAVENVPYGDFFACCLPALADAESASSSSSSSEEEIAPALSAARQQSWYERSFVTRGLNVLFRTQTTVVSLVNATSLFYSALLPRLVAAMHHATEPMGSGSSSATEMDDDVNAPPQCNPFVVYIFEPNANELTADKYLLRRLVAREHEESSAASSSTTHEDVCGTLMHGHSIVFVDNDLLPALERAMLPSASLGPNVRSLFIHRLVFMRLPEPKFSHPRPQRSHAELHGGARVLRPLFLYDVFSSGDGDGGGDGEQDDDSFSFFTAWSQHASAAQACSERTVARRERDLAARRTHELAMSVSSSSVVAPAVVAPAVVAPAVVAPAVVATGEFFHDDNDVAMDFDQILRDELDADIRCLTAFAAEELPPPSTAAVDVDTWMSVEPAAAMATMTTTTTASATNTGNVSLELDDFFMPEDLDFFTQEAPTAEYIHQYLVEYVLGGKYATTSIDEERPVLLALYHLSVVVANPTSTKDLATISANLQFLFARWDFILSRFAHNHTNIPYLLQRLVYMGQQALVRDMCARLGYDRAPQAQPPTHMRRQQPRAFCSLCRATDHHCPALRSHFWTISCKQSVLDTEHSFCSRCLFAITYEAQAAAVVVSDTPPHSGIRCACLEHCLCAANATAPQLIQTDASPAYIVGMEMYCALSRHLSFHPRAAVVALFVPPVSSRKQFLNLESSARELTDMGTSHLALANHFPTWLSHIGGIGVSVSFDTAGRRTSDYASLAIDVQFFGSSFDAFRGEETTAAGAPPKKARALPPTPRVALPTTASSSPRVLLLCVSMLDKDITELENQRDALRTFQQKHASVSLAESMNLALSSVDSPVMYSYLSSHIDTKKNKTLLERVQRLSHLIEQL